MKMENDKYILEGKTVKPVTDVIEWAKGFEISNRRVGLYTVDAFRVSTVFLGLDHGFGFGPPLLFETMVFGGPLNYEMERYSTWKQAEIGHNQIVQDCINACLPNLTANLVRLIA